MSTKLDKYEQIDMVMHQIAKGRASGRCVICGGPKKYDSQVTCLSLRCLRAWLPGNKEAHHDDGHEQQSESTDALSL